MKLSAHEKFMRHLEAKAAAKRAAEKVQLSKERAKLAMEKKETLRIKAACARHINNAVTCIQYTEEIVRFCKDKAPEHMSEDLYKDVAELLPQLYDIAKKYYYIYGDGIQDAKIRNSLFAAAEIKRKRINKKLMQLNHFFTFLNKNHNKTGKKIIKITML